MAMLLWGDTGNRLYEAGVDRGVLFPPNADIAVAWSGLISVNESPVGGDPQPFYLDGIKYLQVSAAEEYAATIEAFSAPDEFAVCDGTANIYAGLFITQQPRQQFDFSYRTLIGNDIEHEDYGYKIHMVYNALAKPSTRDNASIADSTDPLALSWAVTCVPPPITGFMPSAHIVINSLLTDPDTLAAIETIIYGADAIYPRIPDLDEIMTIFAG